MSDIAKIKATPPNGFRFGVFANSVDITHVESGRVIGTFPDEELASAFLYGLIDYRGASPVDPCRKRLADVWDAGWHEHYLEFARQESDSAHPITKTNPYRANAEKE